MKWNIRTQEVKDFITSSGEVSTQLRGISTIRSGDQDIVIIGDSHNRAVVHVDLTGRVVRQDKYSEDIDVWSLSGKPESEQYLIGGNGGGIYAFNKGEILWSVDKETLPDPDGVVFTQTGDALVVECLPSRLLQVSHDGQVVDTVLSLDDKLIFPTGLAYSEELHLLAVAELNSGLLKLYHY